MLTRYPVSDPGPSELSFSAFSVLAFLLLLFFSFLSLLFLHEEEEAQFIHIHCLDLHAFFRYIPPILKIESYAIFLVFNTE